MVQEKKYWSEDEFKKQDGTVYTGYVGIAEEQAYIFDTEEKLIKISNFLTEFNTSSSHFDRILSEKLELPHNKKSIQLQANDFLYSGTIKDILIKLQENNNYIYKNSTISDTLIPCIDDCLIQANNGSQDQEGILTAYNLSEKRVTQTALDPTFYPQIVTDSTSGKEVFQNPVFYSKNKEYKLKQSLWPFDNENAIENAIAKKDTKEIDEISQYYEENPQFDKNKAAYYVPVKEEEPKRLYSEEYQYIPCVLVKKDNSGDNFLVFYSASGVKIKDETSGTYYYEHYFTKWPDNMDPTAEESEKNQKYAALSFYIENPVYYKEKPLYYIPSVEEAPKEKYDSAQKYIPRVVNHDDKKVFHTFYSVYISGNPESYFSKWPANLDPTGEETFDKDTNPNGNQCIAALSCYIKNPDYAKSASTDVSDNLKINNFKYEYLQLNVNDQAKGSIELYEDLEKYKYVPSITQADAEFPFDDIVQTDIRIADIKEIDGDKVAILLLFILFKTKLIIIKVNYNLTDNSKNVGEGCNIDFKNKTNILEITEVDTNSENSLKFLNLKDIEIYDNYMFLVDEKLNMVLRYDISYLINDIDENNVAWSRESIRLLDMLQGKGSSTDQIYFNMPCAVAADEKHIYIADSGNKCVKVYSESFDYSGTLKSTYFSRQDIQAISVNPYKVTLDDGRVIKENSLWVFSTSTSNMFVTIMSEGKQVYYSQIEKLELVKDSYTWDEEFKSVKFSFSESNYYYLSTTKRVYKFQLTKPAYPFASLSYFKQRIMLSSMAWSRIPYPWHTLPAGQDEDQLNITWGYRPPKTSAEILDNRGFALCGCDSSEFIEDTNTEKQFNGDIIFHIGTMYDQQAVDTYIKKYNCKFKDIPQAELQKMVKTSGIFLYTETSSFITTLTRQNMPCYITEEVNNIAPSEYVNALTFNKIVYKVAYNLVNLKNSLIGNFQAGYNLDNIMVYDSIILDDYFQALALENIEDFFIHTNEPTSIIINRIFERIWELQQRLINHMQTEYVAQPAFTNNNFRII